VFVDCVGQFPIVLSIAKPSTLCIYTLTAVVCAVSASITMHSFHSLIVVEYIGMLQLSSLLEYITYAKYMQFVFSLLILFIHS